MAEVARDLWDNLHEEFIKLQNIISAAIVQLETASSKKILLKTQLVR